MKTVLLIAGTRPEAVKLAPVVLELRRRGRLRAVLCSTGQHREMFRQVLETFGLAPDLDLDVMQPGQTLSALAGRMFQALPGVLDSIRPDCVLVQGDTTTAFAGAVAAFYGQVPVGHVEAGLRTGDLAAPFPEEANRRLIGVVTRWHFAPTERARRSLLAEGVPAGQVHLTGNTVIDALLQTARQVPPPPAELRPAPGQRLILVTGHRRESFGEGLRRMSDALARIATAHPEDVKILYPVHPNPQVLIPVRERLGKLPNVVLSDPLGYTEFVALMREAHFLITDSGGVQEEAPALGKPVLVTRDLTERPEAVEAGCARLVGTDTDRIAAAAEELLASGEAYRRMAQARNPFGDGHAAARIADVLERELE